MAMKKRARLLISGIAAFVIITASGAAGARTHWFGLSYPSYSQQVIRVCDNDFRQAQAWLKMAQAALANLEPAAADRYLAKSRAASRDLKARGCPDGPYPLRNHG